MVRALDFEKQARCATGAVVCELFSCYLPGLSVFFSPQPEWWDLAMLNCMRIKYHIPACRAQASHRDVCGGKQQLF